MEIYVGRMLFYNTLQPIWTALDLPCKERNEYYRDYNPMGYFCSYWPEELSSGRPGPAARAAFRRARGTPKQDIAWGICQSVAERVKALGRRLSSEPEIVLTGGVALNPGVTGAVAKSMATAVIVPTEPQVTAAYGAALLARK